MKHLRWRIARWLVGPYFALPETGSWMVHHDAEQGYTFGIRVAEWKGEVTTELAPLDYGSDTRPVFHDNPTTGSFSGTFGATVTPDA